MSTLSTVREPDLAAYIGLDVVILLPTLNEERGLPRTLEDVPLAEIRSLGWSAKPLVIDGGSTDRTREVAASLGIPVVDQRSRGKGAAIREALNEIGRASCRERVLLGV